MKKVLVIMGSDSDLKVMEKCIDRLKSFDIPTEVRICSAHRTPAVAEQLAKNARAEGFGVIIAAAGKAAHLGGVLAAQTLALSDEALAAKLQQFKADMASEVMAKDEKIRAQFA